MTKNKTIDFNFSVLPEYSGQTGLVEPPKENKIEDHLSTDVTPVEQAINILTNGTSNSQTQPINSNGSSQIQPQSINSNVSSQIQPQQNSRTSCSLKKESNSLIFKYTMFSLAAL